MDAGKVGIKLFGVSILILLLSEAGSVYLFSVFTDHHMPVLGGIRTIQLALFLVAVVVFGRGMSDIGLAKDHIMPGIMKGLAWSILFGVAAGIVLAAVFLAGIDVLRLLHTRLPDHGNDILVFFLVGGLVAPVVEEVLFRGILYGFFRRWGIGVALVMSTLFFVLAHQAVHFVQIAGGIIFAVSYEKEGYLMVPITIHILGNLSLFTLSLYAESTIIPILSMCF